jgi:hypothetical protein
MRVLSGMRYRNLIVAAALAASSACAGDSSTSPREGVVVRFAFQSRPDTIRVLITDAATIAAARQFIRTNQGAHIPIGTIEPGAGVDSRYPFHFVPETVRLAELAMELCDGAPMKTSAAVTEFITGAGGENATRATYCPWSAFPVAIEE